ncbi:MAG: hypothetical protein KAT05_15105 [Spirochaetes bacterium]|nr:hypothetical protein [Spirochaetota bacterium]
MRKMFNLLTGLLFLFTIFSCATVVKKIESEKKFITKENAVFESKKSVSKLTIKENKKGKIWAELSSPFISWSKIIGEIKEDATGDLQFYIESIKYLANWPNGWTSGESEASGKIIFQRTETGWQAKIAEPFETWEVIKGEVRYFDDYYRDDAGLKKVKNRLTRIKAVNLFLKENNFSKFYGHVWFKTTYGEPFRKSLRKFLFDKNIEYPEYLIKLKESGTIRRDFEESVGLFFMDYNMEYYFNNILEESSFMEK